MNAVFGVEGVFFRFFFFSCFVAFLLSPTLASCQCIYALNFELNSGGGFETLLCFMSRFSRLRVPPLHATHSFPADWFKVAERLVNGPGRGWASRVFYTDNGSTATEVAIKMGFR